MNLQSWMIGATFVIGVGTMLFGLIALWKNKASAGSGSFKTLGIEASGTGGVVILLVGAAFVMSCFKWATTLKVADTRGVELVKAADAIRLYEVDKAQLQAALKEVPAEARSTIEAKVPALRAPQRWSLPPDLARKVSASVAPRTDHP